MGNTNIFLSLFKQRVKDNFIQNWNDQLRNSTRASTYILFADFRFSRYLDIIPVIKYRYALTRLRTSSHMLEIEIGRWTKPHVTPRSERKCQLCNSLEDEFHFILECPLYNEFRLKYIKKYYWKRPNIPKFIDLFTSENRKEIRNLSMFIFHSMKKRDDIFYLRQ